MRAETSEIKGSRVAIIILNWNNYRDSRRCLESVLTQDWTNVLLVVLDNGSVDGSFEALQEVFVRYPIVWIPNGANLGFAAGCNPGIRLALSQGVDYILLLNNDCQFLDSSALRKGVEFMDLRPSVGISGGKVLWWPEVTRIWSTGGFVRAFGSMTYIGLGETDSPKFSRPEKREFISGALMLIRSSVFHQIGVLAEEYFFGKEDWEFCARALKAGNELWYNPNFIVAHEAGHSQDPLDLTYVYNGALSKILYQKRNLSRLGFLGWYYVYYAYLYLIFPGRYLLFGKNFRRNVTLRDLSFALRHAMNTGLEVEKITAGDLAQFRSMGELRGH